MAPQGRVDVRGAYQPRAAGLQVVGHGSHGVGANIDAKYLGQAHRFVQSNQQAAILSPATDRKFDSP